MTNLVPGQYREVSVTSVDFALSAARLRDFLLGREVYKRTRYIVIRQGPDTALVQVDKAPGNQVMAVVTGVSVLALPDECAFVTAPEVDTGVPSSLARAAREYAPSARAVVVEGRYHHINFIVDPAPVVVRIVDVVPPGPPKLLDQAGRILAIAEELPPISLYGEVVDLADLARSHPAPRYLLPCRGCGFSFGLSADADAEVAFLDERPRRQDWTLIGCARSRELHQWFYRDLPESVEMCPRVLARRLSGRAPFSLDKPTPERGFVEEKAGVTLTKCCLLEDRIDCDGDTVVVPWGASLEQVRQGLAAAVERAAATATAAGTVRAPGSEPSAESEATWSRA